MKQHLVRWGGVYIWFAAFVGAPFAAGYWLLGAYLLVIGLIVIRWPQLFEHRP